MEQYLKDMNQVILYIDKIQSMFYKQKYFYMNGYVMGIMQKMPVYEKMITEYDMEYLEEYQRNVQELLHAYENHDFVSLANVLTHSFRELTCRIIARMQADGVHMPLYGDLHLYDTVTDMEKRHILSLADKTEISDSYILEESKTGNYVLRISRDGTSFYMQSREEPIEEAVHMADVIYKKHAIIQKYGMKKIVLFGLGLGYHVQMLLDLYADIEEIIIIEHDIQVITIALKYIGWDALLNDKVKLVYDPTLEQLGEYLHMYEDNVYFSYPTVKNIQDKQLQQSIHEFFMTFSAKESHTAMMIHNFNANIAETWESVNNIKNRIKGKEVFLLAGGPSIDEQTEYLKRVMAPTHEKRKERIFIVMGSVCNKVLRMGLLPDYTIVTDSRIEMAQIMEHVDSSCVKLLYLSSVNAKVAKEWKSDTYMLFQHGWDIAERYVKENGANEPLIETGGSVATTAFSLALQFHAKAIICMGLDLAYYGGKMHANGMPSYQVDAEAYEMYVESNFGEQLPTCTNLNTYRKWLEFRIANKDKTENSVLINCSKGAKIRGMQYVDIKELETELEKI